MKSAEDVVERIDDLTRTVRKSDAN